MTVFTLTSIAGVYACIVVAAINWISKKIEACEHHRVRAFINDSNVALSIVVHRPADVTDSVVYGIVDDVCAYFAKHNIDVSCRACHEHDRDMHVELSHDEFCPGDFKTFDTFSEIAEKHEDEGLIHVFFTKRISDPTRALVFGGYFSPSTRNGNVRIILVDITASTNVKILAHELGHALGLSHEAHNDSSNIMHKHDLSHAASFTDEQANTMWMSTLYLEYEHKLCIRRRRSDIYS